MIHDIDKHPDAICDFLEANIPAENRAELLYAALLNEIMIQSNRAGPGEPCYSKLGGKPTDPLIVIAWHPPHIEALRKWYESTRNPGNRCGETQVH